jgi:(S)-ureidoglycine aminohydrolase
MKSPKENWHPFKSLYHIFRLSCFSFKRLLVPVKTFVSLLFYLSAAVASAQALRTIPSGKYSWREPEKKTSANLLSAAILSGNSIDLAMLQVDACTLTPSKEKTSLQVPADEEYLVILKSGSIAMSIGESTSTIGRGSVAILVPQEKFTIKTTGNKPCSFYLMKYRARAAAAKKEQTSTASFVTDWNALEFKAHEKGGVRKYFETPTAMFSRIEMHVTTLNGGLKSHEPHTHRPAEIILLLDAEAGQHVSTEMLIGDKTIPAGAGDFYYVEPNILHGITNTGTTPVSYFAFQFQ